MEAGALPAGVRFYPTEPELVGFYLRNKLEHRRPDMERFIPVVDVYSHEPTELPLMSGEASVRDPEQWFFFCPRQAREAQGGRPTRTTRSGYWKATGSPTPVFHDGRVIGIRKTMVFYHGRAPAGRKTSWKMNEYRAAAAAQQGDEILDVRGQPAPPSSSAPAAAAAATMSTGTTADLQWRSEFSLCRLYKKSGHLRSFDRRPILGVAERPGNPTAGVVVDVAGAVHVVPSPSVILPSTSSSRPPHGHGKAAAGAMLMLADDDGYVGSGGSTSDIGRRTTTELLGDGDDDGDCDLEGLDWDSLIGFDPML